MANFDTQGAEFNPALRMLETSDPCHASTFNRALGQLIWNDVALEKRIGAGSGTGSIVLGTENNNSASGDWSVAMGYGTAANGTLSSAMGNGTIANGICQSVRGRYNVEDDVTIPPYGVLYADIVGNGTSDSNRSNAYALTWYGDAHYALDTRNVSAAPADDRALYAAIVALGWESEVIV